ncbi:universal stress family protein [Pasteurella dagmatis ATCC 43325]|uniref:Universal stress protein n=2 Tax=Pasteurella dagmatis TaxID=754 RepID=C9PNY9_9PAST|nr:universal stress family protein [Pasteurella dagmatis ATCC 43325]
MFNPEADEEFIMYKHVLVAVDLSDESAFLLEKAAGVARRNEAKLSIIHVDVNFSDLYTGLIDVNMASMQDRISTETQHSLVQLAEKASYPVSEKLSGSGDLGQVLADAIEKYDIDLLVTGHHQDFWSKLMSSTRQVMNNITVDMLVVPLRDE